MGRIVKISTYEAIALYYEVFQVEQIENKMVNRSTNSFIYAGDIGRLDRTRFSIKEISPARLADNHVELPIFEFDKEV